MKRMVVHFIAVGAAALLIGGCGSDTKPTADGGKKTDGTQLKLDTGTPPTDGTVIPGDNGVKPDSDPTTQCDPAVVGTKCGSASPCKSGWCLLLDQAKDIGICTCDCTPDDSATPLVNEDNCPTPGTECSPEGIELSSGTTQNICMKKCSPKTGANDCAAPFACDPLSAAIYFGFSMFDGQAACFEIGCTTDAECPVLTETACDPAKPACGTGENCVKISTTEGRCAKTGKCDTASGLCTKHGLGKAGAKVGDVCKTSFDCDGNQECFVEQDNTKKGKKGTACKENAECCSGKCTAGACTEGLCLVDFRQGYCTVWGCNVEKNWTDKACGTGAVCNRNYIAGICQKSCDMNDRKTCRGVAGDLYGDYECRAWDNLMFDVGGNPLKISDTPVCDFGTLMDCSLFAGSKSLDCTTFGLDSDPSNQTIENPTKMGCRGFDGKELTDKFSPIGSCLADPGAAVQYRNPLPTP